MSIAAELFTDVVRDVSGGNNKLPQSQFQSKGALKVVDQGQEFVAGYTDDLGYQFRSAELPVVIFGDHTKAVKYIDFPFAMGADGVKVLKPSDKCDAKYLYHWLCQARIPDAGYSRHFKFVKELRLCLPPLPEQRRIAAILDKADALRAKRRLAIAKLDQLLQSVFLEMFGDPVTNPKGWPVRTLGQLLERAEVFTDGDWVESKDQDPDGSVRLIQLANVGDGRYIDKSDRSLNRETAVRLRCTFLKRGDILIARMPDPLGRACIFPGDERDAVTVVDVCVVRPGASGPNPEWLCECLNTSAVREQISRLATGTTRTRISRGNLSTVSVVVPPGSEQERFAEVADIVSAKKSKLQEAKLLGERFFESAQKNAFQAS